MTTTRILPAAVLVAMATAGPAVGQFQMPPYSPPGRTAGLVPGVLPTGGDEAPPPRPAPADSLGRMTNPPPPGTDGAADPVGTLTGQPLPNGLPPGSYGSPWYGDRAGCCGPFGLNGPVVYELYTRTGPNLPFGTGPFSSRLHLGWAVEGGGRTLFFNQAHDAAWAVDLGLSYTYNRGSNDDFLDLFNRQPPQQQTNSSGQTVAVKQPDLFTTTRIRGLHRTSFNFAFGRDWFLWGSGMPGEEPGWNLRVGADVGGRWGTAHVDLVPLDAPGLYTRRQGVYEGIFLGFHSNIEVPMGGWIWFAGTRVTWGYDWTNIVPPINGNIQDINLLLTTGVRF